MDLSIIIVNWNSAGDLTDCLDSVFANAPELAYEVIVVDNASFDGSAAIIESRFPEVRFVQSDTNLGFAQANNLGATYATGDLLLFLNPDTVVVGSAIQRMASALASCPDVGIVGCKLLNSDLTLQTSCVQAFPTILGEALDSECLRRWLPGLRIWGTGALLSERPDPVPVDSVSGACLMIRRDLFERVGQFSCFYFMYVEDRDLCWKVHQSNFDVQFLGSATVIHHGGRSSGTRSESEFASITRCTSLLTYMRRRRGPLHALGYRAAIALVSAVRMSLLLLGVLCSTSGARRLHRIKGLRKWYRMLCWSTGITRSAANKTPSIADKTPAIKERPSEL